MTESEHQFVEIDTGHPAEGIPDALARMLLRLAAKPPLEYEMVRENAARQFRVRVGILDKEVERLRSECSRQRESAYPANGFMVAPDPWPVPVCADKLLNQIAEIASEYLVLPSGAAEAMALWALFAHAHDCFGISPIIAFTSPTPACGKTTCLTLLGALVPRPCPASNITTAALFRSVDKWRPTLLIDEADTFIRNSDELRGVLNSGHQRANAFVVRTVGENHEPSQFRTWAPKAIALIGKMNPTLASRSIHVELRRKKATESTRILRPDRLDHLQQLARQAARWAGDNSAALASADPEMPPSMMDRTADNWRPLLAIADLAGGAWPTLARRVAESFGNAPTEQPNGVLLLSDIQRIFGDIADGKITSGELQAALVQREDSPWIEWRQGKPITPRQIAGLLEPFDIRPGTIRIAGTTAKGYKRSAFNDAFSRYLDQESVTPSQPAESIHFSPSSIRHTTDGVTHDYVQKLAETNVCNGVTDNTGRAIDTTVDWPQMPEFLRRNAEQSAMKSSNSKNIELPDFQ